MEIEHGTLYNMEMTNTHKETTTSHNLEMTTPHHMKLKASNNMTKKTLGNVEVITSHIVEKTPSNNMEMSPSHNMERTTMENVDTMTSHGMEMTPSPNTETTPSQSSQSIENIPQLFSHTQNGNRSFLKTYRYCFITLVCIGLVSNMVIVYVKIKRTRCKSSTDTYLTLLAWSDTLGLVGLMVEFVKFSGPNLHIISNLRADDVLCKVSYVSSYCLSCISIHILTAMTIDRVYVLSNPYKPKPQRKHAIITSLIIIACVLGFFISGITVIGLVESKPISGVNNVTNLAVQNVCYLEVDSELFSWVEFIVSAIGPLFLIIISNSILIVHLKKSKNQIHAFGNPSNTSKDRCLTRKIIAGNCFYVICILPGGLYFPLSSSLQMTDDSKEKLGLSLLFLYVANFSLNLYIYLLSSKHFRIDVMKAFTTCCRKTFL